MVLVLSRMYSWCINCLYGVGRLSNGDERSITILGMEPPHAAQSVCHVKHRGRRFFGNGNCARGDPVILALRCSPSSATHTCVMVRLTRVECVRYVCDYKKDARVARCCDVSVGSRFFSTRLSTIHKCKLRKRKGRKDSSYLG